MFCRMDVSSTSAPPDVEKCKMNTYNLLSSRATALEIRGDQVCIVDFDTRRERFVEDGGGGGEESGGELLVRNSRARLEMGSYSP